MSTTYGKNLKLSIFGGSHDEKIYMTLDGIPQGHKVDMDSLMRLMARRAPGQNKYSTQRKEPDIPVFISGLDENSITTGERIECEIRNVNQHSSDYSSLVDVPRPSHADYAARMKYGEGVDLRGGGHFSGRLTALMCVAGGICMQILEKQGIKISSHIYSIGNIPDEKFDPVSPAEQMSSLDGKEFPVISDEAGEKMKAAIDGARLDGDSVGGVVETAIIGLSAGHGEHIFDGVESRISSFVFSIPAVKGVEFGLGFGSSAIYGSENNDEFYTDGKAVYTKTNNCGGILGGMTNGMPVIFRASLKPTPSIAKEQGSVSLSKMENVRLKIGGRHDPCVVARAVPVFEAAAAVAIYDILLDE